MKKIVLILVSLLWLTFMSVLAQFQPSGVNRSQQKTLIQGKVYYLHVVQKGQTLYSIGKTYGVSQETIGKANPDLDPALLKEGMTLKIPDRVAPAYPENQEAYHAHSVKKGQTIYSIAKKFRVSEEIIYRHNPWAHEGIREGQTLWIPRKGEMPEMARTSDLRVPSFYTVKDNDTLYSVALAYGVDVADIIAANPELRYGLKAGQVIRIPFPKEPVQSSADSAALMQADSNCHTNELNEPLQVALLLPFLARFSMEEASVLADTLTEEETYLPPQKQHGIRGRSYAEFYEGFMLALDSIRKTGVSVHLHVKDTEQDSLTMKRIIRELSDIKPDMIVGPVYPQQVKMAGKYAQAHNIQLISPLSAKPQLVNANSNILQVIPSRMVESEAMARYLKLHAKGQIILIRGTDSASMSNSWRFKKHLLGDMPLDSSGHVLKFRDFKLNDSLMRVLTTVLSKDLNNIVVVFSDHEPGVSRLVTRLNMMSPLYGIELFGMPSWQGMKTIDLNYLHNLQLGIFTPFYIDFSDSAVVKFLKAFRALYGYEPYEQTVLGFNYAMLGYDVGLYFLTALMSYGCDFPLCLKHLNADQLLTKFDFRRSGTGGYVNNSVVIIRYQKDFSVEKLSIVAPAPAF